MFKVETVDEQGTQLFAFEKILKRKSLAKIVTHERTVSQQVDNSAMQCGVEFEFYINAFDDEHFDEELKKLIEALSHITDKNILCNPTKEFQRSKEYDKLIIKPDSSLINYSYGLEVTTPIVPIAQLPYYIEKVFDLMKKFGYITDVSTGLHIHLSTPDEENEFDFLCYMLLLNQKGLFDSWPSRADYSRNVMHVLNCFNFDIAAMKKDEVGRGWCIVRPENDKPTHVELRTMGGDNYHLNISQVLNELLPICELFLNIYDRSEEKRCSLLREEQYEKISEHTPEDISKMYDALQIIGITRDELD